MNEVSYPGHLLSLISRGCLPAVLLLLLSLSFPAQTPAPQKSESEQAPVANKIVQDGIAIEVRVQPRAQGGTQHAELREGQEATVSFSITDAATGTALTGLHPSAWIDPQRRAEGTGGNVCREKVQSFMRGSLRVRPELDLNIFYVLTLNDEANISVIDPLLGYGGSKLLTLVRLNSPGADWVLSPDSQRLFVTQPQANQVAVIDTATWKIIRQIEVGLKPVRIALQPDGKYLWVGNDGIGNEAAQSGVSVIDTESLAVIAQIPTGAGHHELTFTEDDRFAFVTNQQTDTLSVIDIRQLKTVKEIRTEARPVALTYSPLSQAVYVIGQTSELVTVIDAFRHEVLAAIRTKPELRTIRFAPGGRWGFVASAQANVVQIFDAATNQVTHTVPVGTEPDQIAFTDAFAYVRCLGSEQIHMLRLATVGKNEQVDVIRVPGGQYAPGKADHSAWGEAIVRAPEPTAVLIANPADGQIYYLMEEMAAPMGNFQNYRRQPRAVIVVDRSLRETRPGTYTTTVRFNHSGQYDIAFMLEAPRVINCFNLNVQPDPANKNRTNAPAISIAPLLSERMMSTGEAFRLQFKVTDPVTKQAKPDLKDVQVMAMLAPGVWHKRVWAKHIGDGVYEISITPPQAGSYYVFFECRSQGATFQEMPQLVLRAVEPVKSDRLEKKSEVNNQ